MLVNLSYRITLCSFQLLRIDYMFNDDQTIQRFDNAGGLVMPR